MKNNAMVYMDGLIAGIVGGAVIALWFVFMDAVTRTPLYAPAVLGEGLLLGAEELARASRVQVPTKLNLANTGIYGLVSIVLGTIAAYGFLLAGIKLKLGLSTLLLVVILEFGFVCTALVFAEPADELTWTTVLIGNFLTAIGMASYLWLRHANVSAR
jgi:hypothetical protein